MGSKNDKGMKLKISMDGGKTFEDFDGMIAEFVGEMLADSKPSPLEQAAEAMYDLYTALVDAGFTEKQALYLVGNTMKGGSDHA